MPLSALALQALMLLSMTTAAEVLWTDAVALAQQRFCIDGQKVNFEFLNLRIMIALFLFDSVRK
jgi:hypothetical protein